MTDLRKLAKGKPCLVRIPGVCNHTPETTVLAHYSLAGISGRGLKSPDLLGAWCCSACHDEVDRRTQEHDLETVRWSHAEGVLRTQYELIKLGVIK